MKNEKITFDQILDTIVDKNSISKTFARSLVKELTALIQEGLLSDSKVTLAGFGIFKLHEVPARQGRNIQNGEPITIPAHRKVLFKPEKHIRELINKRYEDLKTRIPETGKPLEKASAEKKKDTTETDITLSAIAKSLDQMVKDEPGKRKTDELSDEPLLKDDLLGLEEKEKTQIQKDDDESRKKRLYIGASLIAVILLLLLFWPFAADENDEGEMAGDNKAPVETVTQKEQNTKAPVVQKETTTPGIKYKEIKAVRGDNLWDLAYRHYNDGYLWPLILQANKKQISNPDLIEPGVELKIPLVSNPSKLTAAENKMLSQGHLTAYFEYRNIKQNEAINHLFVADRYDHENVKKSLTKIDDSDYQSIKSLTMK